MKVDCPSCYGNPIGECPNCGTRQESEWRREGEWYVRTPDPLPEPRKEPPC